MTDSVENKLAKTSTKTLSKYEAKYQNNRNYYKEDISDKRMLRKIQTYMRKIWMIATERIQSRIQSPSIVWSIIQRPCIFEPGL
jgi:hypothetical protein